MELLVPKVDDFDVTGDGSAPAWDAASWQTLLPLENIPSAYPTKTKLLYSERGVYVLFDCRDSRLTCAATRDFDDLWTQDVVEAFFWPDESGTVYFEYELSPLGAELPILVPNHQGAFMGWRPWHYKGDRLIRKATAAFGGAKAPMSAVTGWRAEFFVPFALLKGLGNVPPKPGARWRANLYRIDYDAPQPVHWAWRPLGATNFHRIHEFGTIVFGA
jgi:hypothetical protein